MYVIKVKGGAAEVDGRLKPGDQIFAVNSEDMRNSTQEHAATLLKVSLQTQVHVIRQVPILITTLWVLQRDNCYALP